MNIRQEIAQVKTDKLPKQKNDEIKFRQSLDLLHTQSMGTADIRYIYLFPTCNLTVGVGAGVVWGLDFISML